MKFSSLLVSGIALLAHAASAATILETAKTVESLSSLVAIIEAADVGEELNAPNTAYTVFAPSNEAVQALSDSLDMPVADILKLPILTNLLQYHIIPDEAKAADVTDGLVLTTLLEPQQLTFAVKDGDVHINGKAKVTTADVQCDGGIVHIVDQVLLPKNIVELASGNPDFSTLVEAVVAADLADTLSSLASAFTLFAPTNAAFGKALTDLGITAEQLLGNKELLTSILTYHVAASQPVEVSEDSMVTTVQGEKFSVDAIPNTLATVNLVGGTTAKTTDEPGFLGLNGDIYVIDYVLLPPTVAKSLGVTPAPTEAPASGTPSGSSPAAPKESSAGTFPVSVALAAVLAAVTAFAF